MSNGITASSSRLVVSYYPSKPKTSHCYCSSSFISPRSIASSDLKLKGIGFSTRERAQRRKWICNSSGDNESRSVLDAFFLGKAIGEALTERIESTVGEVLSTIGRLQSEQLKQVQDFQEEVLERAKQAKEKAARGAMEAQGLIARPVTKTTGIVPNGTTAASNEDSPVGQSSSHPQSISKMGYQNPVSGASSDED